MSYLEATYYFDYESANIQELIAPFKKEVYSKKDKAKMLYLKIRDSWRYDPYNLSMVKAHYKASTIAKKTSGHCIEKSILLIACLRALDIPSRLHLGKVKNHIAVERLIEKFGTNELTPHGMLNVHLNGKWLKMSPAFNSSLCKKFNVPPLEFDGENDSFLQQYNAQGHLFMEYLEDYGYFDDVPLEFMINTVKTNYPQFFKDNGNSTEFKF